MLILLKAQILKSNLPRLLQSCITALKVSIEKSILQSMNLRSGSWILSGLCIGVKWRAASAWTPYWSRVCFGRESHLLRVGHHRAWSDQSFLNSGNKKRYEYKYLMRQSEGSYFDRPTKIL